MLLAYGRLDSRFLSTQTIQMQEALQAAGAPVTTVVLDGEGDTLGNQADRELLLKSVLAFLAARNPRN